MDEGQKRQEGTLFVYSKPGNKRENQRIPFYRNPKPPLYQSRVTEMKKNFKTTPVRAVKRTMPRPFQWSIKTETKAPIKLKHDIVHSTTNTSFDGKELKFPDDLELSFCNGQLDTSQLEMSITSAVPDVDNNSHHQENTESQEFYQLPTPSKSNVKSRKRTYRDFPNYTYKKPYYSSKS